MPYQDYNDNLNEIKAQLVKILEETKRIMPKESPHKYTPMERSDNDTSFVIYCEHCGDMKKV